MNKCNNGLKLREAFTQKNKSALPNRDFVRAAVTEGNQEKISRYKIKLRSKEKNNDDTIEW